MEMIADSNTFLIIAITVTVIAIVVLITDQVKETKTVIVMLSSRLVHVSVPDAILHTSNQWLRVQFIKKEGKTIITREAMINIIFALHFKRVNADTEQTASLTIF